MIKPSDVSFDKPWTIKDLTKGKVAKMNLPQQLKAKAPADRLENTIKGLLLGMRSNDVIGMLPDKIGPGTWQFGTWRYHST